jgi:hypothetical protein
LKFGSSSASKSAPPSITAVGVPCDATAGAFGAESRAEPGLVISGGGGAPPILARCSFRIALRDSLMRLPSTARDFHQHLVAFFQFIANILDSVFRDFADVQQSIQTRQNFDECAEIRQRLTLPR